MLLVRRDALLVLDFGFDILSGVTGLKGNGLAHQGLHKDLHLCVCCLATSLKRTGKPFVHLGFFFRGALLLILLSCISSLYILNINPLSYMIHK